MTNRVPPNAIEIEKAILGAILLEKDAMGIVSEVLKPDMFYSTANQIVYGAMLELSNKSQPIDLLTITDQLQATRQIETIGGAYYLASLTNQVVSSAHTANHCILFQ